MYISRIRPWLFQLNSQEVYRNLKYRYFKQKVLYRGVQSKVDPNADPKMDSKEYSKVDPKVEALRDKLIYCDHLDLHKVRMGYLTRIKSYKKEQNFQAKLNFDKLAYEPAYSVLLDQVPGQESHQEGEDYNAIEDTEKPDPLYMPYAKTDSYEIVDEEESYDTKEEGPLNEKYVHLYEKYLEIKKSGSDVVNPLDIEQDKENELLQALPEGELWKVPSTWLYDYEEYDDTPLSTEWYKNYGTPDPNSKVSSVPCSGCGALLHCKDPAIPGYLPSELFSNKKQEEMRLMICQRCHFLKFYNAALKVKVSIEDYPKLLSVIKRKKCAIILVVDLTDFPCSIWPDLKSIMHPFTPIFLVGNKVDLLPRDCSRFMENVKQRLVQTVVNVTGVSRENITHVQLVSAETKFGIEELINKLQFKWSVKGDVYLVGCTNVGKSTLFNTLLNSDYCKVGAVDLVPRATVSAWPGTTLNLLKFPILNPTGERSRMRTVRLIKEQQKKTDLLKERNKLFVRTRNMKYATLIGTVGRTFSGRSVTHGPIDSFAETSHKFMLRKPTLDESLPEFKDSRWCYDTPGTIQTDQILDLLTTDELMLTLPKTTMYPRTFVFRPKQTVFVAGLGRLDYLDGEYYIRCTLFMSSRLPITICHTVDADELYNQLLETKAFVVPTNDPERLKVWPRLESKEFKITGVRNESAADVVLSNAGWIAITPHPDENVVLRAWTPQGRGIHLRSPALLGRSVFLRGWKVHGTPMYLLGKKVDVSR